MAKVLEFQFQHQSFQWIFRTDFLYDELVGPPCGQRDSQESSPTLQFKNINSSVLSFLYSPTLTSVHDQWKNHNFDYTDLCQQNVHSSCWPPQVPGAWTCHLEFSWCFLFSTGCGHGCQGVISELHRDCAPDSWWYTRYLGTCGSSQGYRWCV